MAGILIAVFVIGLLVGLPVSMTMGLSGAVAVLWDGRFPAVVVPQQLFNGINTFPLMAVPFFIFTGFLMERTGLIGKLFQLADAMVGWVPGGFAYATLIACVMFGAISVKMIFQDFIPLSRARSTKSLERNENVWARMALAAQGQAVHPIKMLSERMPLTSR